MSYTKLDYRILSYRKKSLGAIVLVSIRAIQVIHGGIGGVRGMLLTIARARIREELSLALLHIPPNKNFAARSARWSKVTQVKRREGANVNHPD
ncbi:hypothetical protein AG1IA_06694 [Rhizoctonia solani AG-1 IA]|uniref:Uncharacterized protein n=1 Tax=Thanatephorus cucumeris (strain AG1-IA) TaxID=983506 RepID=L8WR90_THACA|nr:hypothetical protein AG1IA_06694 [Rhizoctonia solani AG-1 IA]